MPDTWDYTTSRPRKAPLPILTWLIGALCIAFTAAFHMAPGGRVARFEEIGRLGYLPLTAIWSGGYTALFTSVFVHGGVVHLAANMLGLLVVGRILEETVNPFAWCAFFVAAAAVASASEIALSSVAPIGVSGVVYAMFGLVWAGRREVPVWRTVATRGNLLIVLGWGLFCVAATWLHVLRVANGAHAGGFLFGLACGYLFVARRHRLFAAAALCGLAALTVCSVSWMPWSASWTQWKGDQEALERNDAAALRWYRRSLRLGAQPPPVLAKILVVERRRGNAAGAEQALRELLRYSGARVLRARPSPAPSTAPGKAPPDRTPPTNPAPPNRAP